MIPQTLTNTNTMSIFPQSWAVDSHAPQQHTVHLVALTTTFNSWQNINLLFILDTDHFSDPAMKHLGW